MTLPEPQKRLQRTDAELKELADERTDNLDAQFPPGQGGSAAMQQAAAQYDPQTTAEINLQALNVPRPVMPFGASAAAPAPPSKQRAHFDFDEDDDNLGTAVYDINALRSRSAALARSAIGHESTQVIKTSELLGGKPAIPFAAPSSGPGLANSPPMAPPPSPSLSGPLIAPPRAPVMAPPMGFAPMAPPPPPGLSSAARPMTHTPTATGFGPPPTPPSAPSSLPSSMVAGQVPPAPPPLQRAPGPVFTGMAGASDYARTAPGLAFGEPPAPPRPLESPLPKTIGEMQVKSKPSAAYEGVLAASNAAAEPQYVDKPYADMPVADKPIQEKSTADEGVAIEVIWYESSYVPRMRKLPQWSALCKPPPKPAPVQRGQAPSPPPSPEALDEAMQADVFAILTQGEATREHEVVPGRKGGKDREAALYLLAGTISFPLDDIEMLKATSRAAAPLAASDKKLKEVLEMVEEVLKMPLEGAPEVVQGFIVRVREAWSSANRMLPPDYLVTHTERTLLNQRHYQKRELLDDEWIRSLYHATPDAPGIPTYIPAKLAKRLPLFRQVSARIIVEALSQQDMYESHPMALRAVALARVLASQDAPQNARGRR